ncbi:hemicentin-1-like [Branchiostoma floridae]|uniref:Hemicentin-1-like n=1 Tax=Branchiostoma floridae TaxID=7739 RepID=A0A9J7MAK7_BRAFL|nr:hemicentin-1-like [Branchiostoma floridae]
MLLAQILIGAILLKDCAAGDAVKIHLPDVAETALGDTATLPAKYSTGYRVISIIWHKVDIDSTSQQRRSVFSYVPDLNIRRAYGVYKGRAQLVGQASLRIDRTMADDEGMYALSIMTDEQGTDEKFIRLELHVPPRLEVGPSNPYITTWGKTVSLMCTVRDAKPNITSLYWGKDGGRIEANGYKGKYSGGNVKSPSLIIRRMTRADAGLYTCFVHHPVRPAAESMLVRVQYPASIISISDPVEVTVSDHVTFQCVADGNPTPNITWSKHGRLLRANSYVLSGDVRTSSLVLNTVEANDSGTYSCAATNGVGQKQFRTTRLDVTGIQKDITTTVVAVVIGATASILWLLICLCLLIYFLKRRRKQEERKKFAFYYDIASRRDHATTDANEGQDLRRQSALPDKPEYHPADQNGIDTLRKNTQERRYARAMYDYKPRDDNELRLEAGDVIEVLEGEAGDWCLGFTAGRVGLFPSNYVVFISASEVIDIHSPDVCCLSDGHSDHTKDGV